MSLPPLAIDERLEAASTLPAAWYTDPQALELEQPGVFARTRQLVARLVDLEAAGDHVTAQVAGEPIVLVRGEDGRLRALSNVCRHRAGPVAGGSGNRKAFSCGYHGWTYGLDGRLLRAPEFEGVSGFDSTAVRLPEFRCEAFGPFAFVKLDAEAPTLAEWMREVVMRTAALPLARMRRLVRREYEVDCNWKVYVDNYLEGYHLPIVHPALFRELDYAAYRVEPLGNASLQDAPIRRGGGAKRRYATPRAKRRTPSTSGSFRT